MKYFFSYLFVVLLIGVPFKSGGEQSFISDIKVPPDEIMLQRYIPNEYVVYVSSSKMMKILDIKLKRKSLQNTQFEVLRFYEKNQIFVVKSKLNLSQLKNTFNFIVSDLRDVLFETECENFEVIIEPNYYYYLHRIPNDPLFEKLWGLRNVGQLDPNQRPGLKGIDIGLEGAWNITTGSKDVIVAVIDTGVSPELEDLKNNMWVNAKEFNGRPGFDDDKNGFIDDIYGYDFVENKGLVVDDFGHGSHCAGTIGAVGNDNFGLTGVLWQTQIMALKFISLNGGGTLEDAVRAIDYAVDMGAKVLNNSWGGGEYSEILKKSIENANQKGVVFVASAGNSQKNNDDYPSYPATYNVDNVIAVGAIDNQGRRATFSNYGSRSVHLMAPGVHVFSITPDGYRSWEGTSMAAPHVTGVVALLMGQEPRLTPLEIRERLINTSQRAKNLHGFSVGGIPHAYYAMTNTTHPIDPEDSFFWPKIDYQLDSPHPYSDSLSETYVVNISQAKRFVLHFSRFETELTYDTLTIYNSNRKMVMKVSGIQKPFYSKVIDGDTAYLEFKTNHILRKFGFSVDYVKADKK